MTYCLLFTNHQTHLPHYDLLSYDGHLDGERTFLEQPRRWTLARLGLEVDRLAAEVTEATRGVDLVRDRPG